MVADGGDGVAATEIFICKSEGFWGSDVLPGSRVDVFYGTWDSRVIWGKTRLNTRSYEKILARLKKISYMLKMRQFLQVPHRNSTK